MHLALIFGSSIVYIWVMSESSIFGLITTVAFAWKKPLKELPQFKR